MRPTVARRLGAIVVLVVLAGGAVAGCATDPDGELIDGIWVGEPADCGGPNAPDCEGIVACATLQEWRGHPPDDLSAQVFNRPARLRNGTILIYGVGASIVVFELANGAREARYVFSTDAC